MPNDNKVDLEIGVETQEAESNLRKFELSAGKAIDAIKANFGLLAGAAVAAVGAFATGALFDYLKEGVQAAAEADAEVAKLEASLRSLGEYTPEVVNEFNDFATGLERSSKFTAEAALSQVAFSKQLGLTNEESKKLVQAAADLASVTGDTLESAVSELSNSYLGNVKSLAKTIPEVKSFTEEQLKSGAAVDFVAERLKGASTTAIESYAGAMAQLSNVQGDFQEELGRQITQSPAVIAAVSALRDAFIELTNFVGDNKEELGDLIGVAVEFAANTIPYMVVGVGLAVQTFNAFGIAILKVSDFLGLTDGAADKAIDSFNTINKVIEKTAIAATGAAEKIKFANSDAGKAIRKLAEDEKAAGQDAIKASVQLANQKAKAFEAEKKAGEERKKLSEQAIAFEEKLLSSTGTGLEKLQLQRDKDLKELEKFHKARVLTDEKYSALRGTIEKDFYDKTQELRDKDLQQVETFKDRVLAKELEGFGKIQIERKRDLDDLQGFLDEGLISVEEAEKLRLAIIEDSGNKEKDLRKKKMAEARSEIEAIVKDPFTAIIQLDDKDIEKIQADLNTSLKAELGIDEKDLNEFQKRMAAILGGVAQILQGKEGARNFISNLVGKVADAFVPGIGAVVSQIVSALSQGPDQTKKMVNEFVEAIPVFIEAIAEAIPAFVDAFVTSMITKGGVIKIGVAIAKAMLFIPAFQAMGRTISKAFTDSIGPFFKKLGQDIVNIFKGIASLFSRFVTDAFKVSGQLIFDGIGRAFSAAGKYIGQIFTDLIPNIATQLYNAIATAFDAVFKFFTVDLPRELWNVFVDIGEAIARPFVEIYNLFADMFNSIAKFNFGSIFGGGKSGKKFLGIFAKGGVVPNGYPNDTFNARLTSKEMVLPPDIASGLINIIDQGGPGLSSSSEERDASMIFLMQKMVTLLENPQTVTAKADLNGRVLADIILQLSRNNARLTA